MSVIPQSKTSPRIEDGVLYYYKNDTWKLTLLIELSDSDGSSIEIGAGDRIEIEISTCAGAAIATLGFSYDNGDVVDGQITIHWTTKLSSKLPKGRYHYRIRFNGDYVTTIASDNCIVVE